MKHEERLLKGCGRVLGHGECCSTGNWCDSCEEIAELRGIKLPWDDTTTPLSAFTDFGKAKGPSYLEGK